MKDPEREYIGKVCIDLTCVRGTDPYEGDPDMEKLLEIVKRGEDVNFSRRIAEKKSSVMLYHLSAQRQNIVAGLEIRKDQNVLEIGSECGAVTGKLAQMAGHVTCVETSETRSVINAWRNRDCENIEIRVGDMDAIRLSLREQYDIITVIGTPPHAGTRIAPEDFFRRFGERLKPQGKLIVALDNKYGLKYWAGCREEYSHAFFGNFRNGADEELTECGRGAIRTILEAAGYSEIEFYYPYPDYRYPICIYSDDYLPQRGELVNNVGNPGEDRMILFNETLAYENLISDGLFPLFSNSFLIICGRGDVQ